MALSGQGVFKKFLQALLSGAIGNLNDCTFSVCIINATGAAALDAGDAGNDVFGDINSAWLTHGPNALTKHADFLNANRLLKFENLVDGLTDLNNANNSDNGTCVIWYISAGSDDSELYLVKYSTTATNLPVDQDGVADTVQANASGEVRIGGA